MSEEIAPLDVNVEDQDANDLIVLQAKDGFHCTVKRRVVQLSQVISTMTRGSERTVLLENIHGKILQKVIEFLEYYIDFPLSEIERPLRSSDMKKVVGDWYANYVNVPQDELFELITASNYLGIGPLLDLTCAKVAAMIKGKTPREIIAKFNIQNDFTPEEEDAVRAEQRWAEEEDS
jgi:S-phase kinase-associated protein 1